MGKNAIVPKARKRWRSGVYQTKQYMNEESYYIAPGERPRERLREVGPTALAQRELLAIILQHGPQGVGAMGLADELLRQFNGLAGLARASLQDLQRIHGVGEVKATQIKAVLELGKRLMMATPDETLQIKTPSDAANFLMPKMGLLEQEEVHTILLDTRNRIMGCPMIYKGSLNSASMRIGEIFKEAIRNNCASIIVAHNHPSGSPDPSAEDVRVTKIMVQAGKTLDVEVLDHMVICQNRYISLKERGLGFGD